MSNDIDLTLQADPGPVDRLIAAVDRLHGSLDKLGSTRGLSAFQRQMAEMHQASLQSMRELQATISTGFAEMAALSERGARTASERTAQALKEGGDKAAEAATQAGLKIKAANAATWEQVTRGSAENVTRAFHQLAQGIPVEAVEKRFGDLAASTAASMNGQIERLRQFQANSKSGWETHYRGLAGASEAEIALARKMNAEWDRAMRAKSASNIDPRTLLGLPSEDRMRSLGQQIAAQMREAVTAENLRARSASNINPRTLLGLPSQAETRSMGQQIAAQMREAVTAENLRARSATSIDARTLLGLPTDAEARSIGRQIAAQMREAAEAEAAVERQRRLNATFQAASPRAQLGIATRARVHADLGGNAAEVYGSAAATADLAALYARLAPAVDRSGRALRGHNDLMHEGHSLARGLAGSLGGLWLTYGSLVPLVAGAAIAGSLKQIVSAGRDVEHQLNFVVALQKQDVSLDKFLHVTDSSLRSVRESAEAMRMLAQNGLSVADSLRALPAVLNLATVGEMSVGQAALAATGAVAAFGLEISQVERVANIFAKTAANSNTSVLAITESMKQASTVASLFHVSIEETAAMLGLLAKINITGGAAGTAMTNMLTGLYEPTEQGKRALAELGVQTQTTSGQLKPLTQLLDELKTSLSGYTDHARVDFLGSIFTVRGVKSAEMALQNIDQFKEKLKEAQEPADFMRDVVKQLENDTTGVFTRLGVTVQNTFIRSFAEASPFIQRLGLDLQHAFKGDGVQSGLSNLTTNMARLTGTLANNVGTVTAMAAAYVGYRLLLAPLIPLVVSAAKAAAAQATAEAAATAAAAAHSRAMAVGSTSAATYTAMIEANTVATAAATTTATAWRAAVLPALGALAVAVAAGAALWLLFRDNTSEVERTNVKLRNSLDAMTESLDREIDRLEKINALWDKRSKRFVEDKSGMVAEAELARMQVADIEAKIRAEGGSVEQARSKQYKATAGGMLIEVENTSRYSRELREADRLLAGINAKLKEFDERRRPVFNAVEARQAHVQLVDEIQAFASQADQKDLKGNHYQQNESIRAIYGKGKGLLAELDKLDAVTKDKLSDSELKTYLARADQVRTSLRVLKDEASKLQSDRAPKPTTGPGSAGWDDQVYRAKMVALDEKLQQVQLQARTTKRDIESLLQTGAISAVEAAEKVHAVDRGVMLAMKQNATEKAELAVGRPADIARAARQGSEAMAGLREADAEHARRVNEELKAAEQDKTQYLIEQARKQGNSAQAYRLQHAEAMMRNEQNLAFAREQYDQALARGDAKAVAAAAGQISAFEGVKTRAEDAIAVATNVDAFKHAEQALSASLANLRNNIAEMTDGNQELGLSAMYYGALEAQQAYEASLPGLQVKLEELKGKAALTGDPRDDEAVEKLRATMHKTAEDMRKLWRGVGQEIAVSLEGAFGKAGKAAGGVVRALTHQAAERKRIQDDLKKQEGSADYEKQRMRAMQQLDSLALTTYANMAGAARSYFEEGSSGYEMLGKIERAFHATQLAMTMANMASKLLATETTTGAKLNSLALEQTAEAASVPVVTAAEGAKSSAYGMTALAASLALPFPASLPAYATVAAMLATIGVAINAGGGGTASTAIVDAQAKQGTGSVLGNKDEKSASIAKSLKTMEQLTIEGLDYSAGMLQSLRAIEASMTGFTHMVVGGMKFQGWAGEIGSWDAVQTTGITTNKVSLGSLDQLQAAQYSQMTLDGRLGSRSQSPLSATANNQFKSVITDISDAVTNAANLLGVGGQAFTQHLQGFVIDLGDIDLSNLTGEEIQKQFEAVFSKLGDDMAQYALGGLSNFQRVGEGYFETLNRVAAEYRTVDVTLAMLGKTFGLVGLSSISAREQLVLLAGGIDELVSQTTFFSKNFLTRAEQMAPLQAEVNRQLASVDGGSAVRSMEDFKALVLRYAGDTSDTGMQAYTALLRLAPAFKTLADSIKEVADEATGLQDQLDQYLLTSTEYEAKRAAAERAKLDPANQALFDQVQAAKLVAQTREQLVEAYEREKQAMEENISRIEQLAESWKSFRDGLLLGDKSTLTPEEKYLEARSQFLSTQARARGGDAQAQADFQAMAEKFLEASRLVNASSPQYAQDFQLVLSSTEQALQWAAQQVDIGKASLEALKEQVSVQVRIEEATLSVAEAIARLSELLDPTGTAVNVEAAMRLQLNELYQSLLGRTADQAGADFWLNAMRTGSATMADVGEAIRQSAEYQNTHQQPTSSASNAGAFAAQADSAALAEMTAQLAKVNENLEALRREQDEQSVAEGEAAQAAATQAADKVVAAVEKAVEDLVWASNNKAEMA